MSGTLKRVVGPTQLGNSAATLYTVPSGQRIVIRGIHLSNGDADAPHLATLSIGSDTAGTRIYDAFPIPASQIEDNYGPYELVAGEIIQGFADTASKIVVTIDAEVMIA